MSCLSLTKEHTYTTSKELFITVAMPMVTLFGFVVNSAFFIVLYRVPYMRTITNFYLANLAISDVTILFITCVWHILYYVVSPIDNILTTPFDSVFACSLPHFITYTVRFASVIFVTLVTLERYIAICHPVAHRNRNGAKQAMMAALASWVISMLLGSCMLPVEVIDKCITWPHDDDMFQSYPKRVYFCDKPEWSLVIVPLVDISIFSFCFITNSIAYILIVTKLSSGKSSKQNESLRRPTSIRNTQKPSRSSKARNHIARMLIINTFVFFSCLVPLQCINLHVLVFITQKTELLGNKMIFYIVLWLGRVTFLVNSAINPVLYSASNPRYFEAFKKAFRYKEHSSAEHLSLQGTKS